MYDLVMENPNQQLPFKHTGKGKIMKGAFSRCVHVIVVWTVNRSQIVFQMYIQRLDFYQHFLEAN